MARNVAAQSKEAARQELEQKLAAAQRQYEQTPTKETKRTYEKHLNRFLKLLER